METFIRHFIHQSLSFQLYENAIFLSERLFAETPSIPHLLLVAKSYYESGQYNVAYHMLKYHSSKWDVPFKTNTSSSDTELTKSFFDFLDPQESIFYLFSLCCIKLEHYIDAERYLRKCHDHNENNVIINYWLGIVYKLTCRKELAIYHFHKCVSLCPMLWSAYEHIAQLGYDRVEADGLFDPSKSAQLYERFSQMYSDLSGNNSNNNSINIPLATNFSFTSAMKPPTNSISKQADFLHATNRNNISDNDINMDQNTQFPTETGVSSTPNKPKSSYEFPLVFNPTATTTAKTPNLSAKNKPRASIGSASRSSFGNNEMFSHSTQQTPNSFFYRTPSPQQSPSSAVTHPPTMTQKPKPSRKSQASTITSTTSKKITFESTEKKISRSSLTSSSSESEDSKFSLYPSQSLHSFPKNFKASPQRMYQLDSLNQVPTDSFLNPNIGFNILSNLSSTTGSAMPVVNSNTSPFLSWQSVFSLNYKQVTVNDVSSTLALLNAHAIPLKFFSQYKGKEAIENFEKLPPKHYQSGWVLQHVGRSHFEMAQYEDAETAFERIQMNEPYRLDGLEIYSTILWHLKKDKKLSYLAQHMSEIDKTAPQTLCAIGNCFSQQKDHETALKFFEKATKVDNLFTYAYTLAGHERAANDDLEGALQCYRHAIRIDDRHYNAWYGIGAVYFRQEKYQLAMYHFSKAISINSKSSVLYCYAGMAEAACGRYEQAIKMFTHAIRIHPQNPMPKFKKANALIALQRYNEALDELKELKQMVPKESQIYFTCGKIYAARKQKEQALYEFNMALDLDSSKENPLIKEAISKLFEEEDLQEAQKDDKLDERDD
ncbi:hypothetical protein FDP41_007193 [Naegleria fowleri]|uniref:Uncharacterized protein n=1 Tax=Naegleria fowleri TaxID=5763 RepID=A0A6A5BGL1_NAEFO|nr:uncharacterized protein FDP41_007193 [Naegleria fowleri]KAF0973806.1 hypothetical protein FDP41_007193 [Naegleria fowleri]CAG4717623.1 unnamed protein product [Naegleria fowleri]